MELYLLTHRDLLAAPHSICMYDFEDLLVETCQAQLLTVRETKVNQTLAQSMLPKSLREIALNSLEKIGKKYQPISDLPVISQNNTQVLFINALSPAYLNAISCIKDWRNRFDLVIAFIYDVWILSGFPNLTHQIDHIFVPVSEFVPIVEERYQVSTTFLPHAVDVLKFGSKNLNRSIDVTTYGRTPSEYHLGLFELLNNSNNNHLYYRQVSEPAQKYPEQSYNYQRFDYQHRQLLAKILSHSKITLAFDFSYTVSRENEISSLHPSYRYKKPVLTPRWFEGLAAGCAVVGKHPPLVEVKQLIGWEDATIELPDDPKEGIDVIIDLLEDQERLHQIHQRNYAEMLNRHDNRWRIKKMLEILNLPIPQTLQNQLDYLKQLGTAQHEK